MADQQQPTGMPLEFWVAEEKKRLDEFAEWWLTEQKTDAETFPEAMPEGEWDEQYRLWGGG